MTKKYYVLFTYVIKMPDACNTYFLPVNIYLHYGNIIYPALSDKCNICYLLNGFKSELFYIKNPARLYSLAGFLGMGNF